MPTHDYLADYARLGLQPGCSPETLERTWRLAVSDLHPDRACDADDREARTRRLHELTAAYRRLQGFMREHGRLPGGTVRPAPAVLGTPSVVEPTTRPAAGPAGPHEPARRGRSGWPWWLALTLAGLLWLSHPGFSEHPPAAPSPAVEEQVSGKREPARSAGAQTSRGWIRIGSSEAHVERLLGPPLVLDADTWQYGPSHVRFDRGRVAGWYSSPLNPLPVDVESR